MQKGWRRNQERDDKGLTCRLRPGLAIPELIIVCAGSKFILAQPTEVIQRLGARGVFETVLIMMSK